MYLFNNFPCIYPFKYLARFPTPTIGCGDVLVAQKGTKICLVEKHLNLRRSKYV